MYTFIPRLHVTESRIYIITLNKFIYGFVKENWFITSKEMSLNIRFPPGVVFKIL